MALVWEEWGHQNLHREDGSKPAPLNLPKMLWAQQVGAAGQEEQASPHCTSPGPGQAGIHELGTPSHGVQEDHRTTAGRRFPTPLHPWQLLLSQGPMACTKLSEVPPVRQEAAKGDFMQGAQPWHQGSHLCLHVSLSGCAVSSQNPTTTSVTTSPPTHQCYSERCLFLFFWGGCFGNFLCV